MKQKTPINSPTNLLLRLVAWLMVPLIEVAALISAPTDAAASADVRIVEVAMYAINLSQTDGGTIAVEGGMEAAGGGSVAIVGDQITITATPNVGYALLSIKISTGNGTSEEILFNDNKATFTMPNSDVTITPTFVKGEVINENGISINMPTGVVYEEEEFDAEGNPTGNYYTRCQNETHAIFLTSAVKSFNLYDNGGDENENDENAYYSDNCDGSLAITAPEGTLIQVTGSINTESGYDWLYVYDGLSKEYNLYTGSGEVENISILSSGNTMLIKFTSDDGVQKPGLNLVVSVVEDKGYNITIPTTEGGSAAIEKTTAKGREEIAITITPSENYFFNSISVTDGNGNPVAVHYDGFSTEATTATFTMPYDNVTITPIFATDVTVENGAFVTMPKGEEKDNYGNIYTELETRTITLNENVKSFYIYDDGGEYDEYSNKCNGEIAIYAPEGKLIQVTGSSDFAVNDYLYAKNDNELLYDSYEADANINFINDNNQMSIGFQSDNENYEHRSGLRLKVDILDNVEHDITFATVTGGSALHIIGTNKAKFNESVTISVTPEESYYFGGISVMEKESGKAVSVNYINWTINTASFTMPYADVTVTPIFVSELSVDGGLSFDMPASGSYALTLSEDVKSFKVYDNSINDVDGTIYILAPEGKLIQVSGSIKKTPGDNCLDIYDKTTSEPRILYSASGEEDIATITSGDNTMQIYFGAKKGGKTGEYLDLTVTLIDNVAHNITVNEAPNGSISVEEGKTSAKTGDVINLAAVPAEGYYLMNIEVKDADNNTIAVANGDFFTNDASFEMPLADVTITATFATEISAENGASICMPTSDGREIALPETVKSFHLYDDGGRDGNYSSQCNGQITLTAPEGKIIKITGSADISKNDKLSVFDGAEECLYSNYSENKDIDVASDKMRIGLYSQNNVNNSGIDWIVSVEDKVAHSITVNNPTEGGTVSVTGNKTTANLGDEISLTASAAEGYILVGITVTDENNNSITVTGGDWLNNTATFVMPYANVTVTPAFGTGIDIYEGYSINMPAEGTKEITLPSAVKSFYLYDDGDHDNSYSDYCNGTLKITAPEGSTIQISGTMNATGNTSLSIGDEYQLYGQEWESVSINHTTQNNVATITFASEDENYFSLDGLNLTVTIIPLHSITVNNPTEGGTAQSNKTAAKEGEEITITATPAEGYYFIGIDVKDADGNLITTTGGDWLSNNNTATFSMPSTDVTVTPKFVTEITAEAGAYINMPYDNEMEITLSSAVKSFHLYDDGGKDGNYSNECGGTLAFTAPDGTLIHIEGSFVSDEHDNLWVSDLLTNQKLYNGTRNDNNIYITSSGNKVRIDFISDYGITCSGLDLIVSIVENVERKIEIASVEGGTVTANKYEAKANEEITITAAGHYLLSIDVTDENGKSITVTGGNFLNNTATFTMPCANVTVTPKFITEITAEAGAYINMPRGIVKYTEAGYEESVENETREINLTSAVKSFHLYDDGGKDGNYSDKCDGSLAITAPEGTVIQVTGSIETEGYCDFLYIYDGLTEGTELYKNSGEVENISITSSGNTMLIKFTSDGSVQKSGLDLVVSIFTPIMTITEDEEGVKTATFHGTSSQTLEIKTATTVDKVVYDRKFTPEKPSTVMLPFNYTCNGNEGGKFYEFAGVTKDDNGIWTAVMQEPGDNDANETTLKANTPYIFKPSAETMQFPNTPDGGFRLCTTVDGGSGSKVSDWQFIGTYSAMTWTVTTGKDYGFAAKAGTGKDKDGNDVTVAQGEFVQLTEGAFSKPMRAYLRNIHDEGISKAATELPSTIEVIFIDRTAKTADEPNDNPNTEDISGNDGDITTPISEINPGNTAKAWSYEKTIFIEGNAGSAYHIIDVSGRILRTDVLRTTRDEIYLGAHTSGIVVVIINGKIFKLNY